MKYGHRRAVYTSVRRHVLRYWLWLRIYANKRSFTCCCWLVHLLIRIWRSHRRRRHRRRRTPSLARYTPWPRRRCSGRFARAVCNKQTPTYTWPTYTRPKCTLKHGIIKRKHFANIDGRLVIAIELRNKKKWTHNTSKNNKSRTGFVLFLYNNNNNESKHILTSTHNTHNTHKQAHTQTKRFFCTHNIYYVREPQALDICVFCCCCYCCCQRAHRLCDSHLPLVANSQSLSAVSRCVFVQQTNNTVVWHRRHRCALCASFLSNNMHMMMQNVWSAHFIHIFFTIKAKKKKLRKKNYRNETTTNLCVTKRWNATSLRLWTKFTNAKYSGTRRHTHNGKKLFFVFSSSFARFSLFIVENMRTLRTTVVQRRQRLSGAQTSHQQQPHIKWARTHTNPHTHIKSKNHQSVIEGNLEHGQQQSQRKNREMWKKK